MIGDNDMKRELSNVAESKVTNALELLSNANNAMIEAITQAVNDNKDKEMSYDENVDKYSNCGYTETRTIKFNEEGELVMFDDCDNELVAIEDLSADDLYDICVKMY
jgi:hypothetical protein